MGKILGSNCTFNQRLDCSTSVWLIRDVFLCQHCCKTGSGDKNWIDKNKENFCAAETTLLANKRHSCVPAAHPDGARRPEIAPR